MTTTDGYGNKPWGQDDPITGETAPWGDSPPPNLNPEPVRHRTPGQAPGGKHPPTNATTGRRSI